MPELAPSPPQLCCRIATYATSLDIFGWLRELHKRPLGRGECTLMPQKFCWLDGKPFRADTRFPSIGRSIFYLEGSVYTLSETTPHVKPLVTPSEAFGRCRRRGVPASRGVDSPGRTCRRPALARGGRSSRLERKPHPPAGGCPAGVEIGLWCFVRTKGRWSGCSRSTTCGPCTPFANCSKSMPCNPPGLPCLAVRAKECWLCRKWPPLGPVGRIDVWSLTQPCINRGRPSAATLG